MWLEAIVLGMCVGVLVGLLGIGGGIVMVPAMVYLLNFEQHVAQGTSLFMLLPPTGLGALYVYWKKGNVDVRAGVACAIGFLVGGYFGSLVAIGVPSRDLQGLFGVFLMFAAMMLWRQTVGTVEAKSADG